MTTVLLDAQRAALRLKLFEAFKSWAEGAGWNVDNWSIGDSSVLVGDVFGLPVNPLGDPMTFYDAAHSLQRIAEMRALHPASLVSAFYFQARAGDDPELPCQLNKDGKPAVVVWATWDGESVYRGGDQRMGPVSAQLKIFEGAPTPPAAPAVLVSVEGTGPEDGKWTEPIKVYTLLEFGFKLGRFGHPTDPDEEDIPF